MLPGLAADAEPQWHPSHPDRLYFVPTNGGMVLQQLDVASGAITTAARFAGKLPWGDVARVWTRSEGSPSADGRFWCFQAETDGFQIRGVFTYDLETQRVIGTRALTARPDHVSMSASWRWCVVSHLDGEGGTVAWDPTFTNSLSLHHTSEHSDLALAANGDAVFVFVDYQSNRGDLMMVNHSTFHGYWTEPHASVDRDFRRVSFSSNWGNGSDTDVDAFLLRLPDTLAIFAPERPKPASER